MIYDVASVDSIIEDFNSLEHETETGLSKEGWTNVSGIMEENDYWNQLEIIRTRIKVLTELLQQKLAQLKVSVGAKQGGTGGAEDIRSEIGEIQSLLSQLMDVWKRLETFVSLIDQKKIAQGVVSKTVARAKTWLATIASWIKRISSELWALLSKFLTPKEWKLGGKVGNTVLG